MGKKKAVKPAEPPNKARLELRFDNEVYEKVKHLADEAQISVNQLMQALALWAGTYGHAGEPQRDADGLVRTKEQPGCVWIGKSGWRLEDIDPEHDPWRYEAIAENYRGPVKGEIELVLDFTERRVLRDDIE